MRLLHEEVEYDIKESILPEEIKTDPSWIRRWFGVNRIVPTLSRLLGTYAGRPTLVQTTSGGALSVSGAVSPYGGLRLYYVTQDLSYPLASNAQENVWIVPAEGYVATVAGVYVVINPPTDATSGSQYWGLCMMGITGFGLWGSWSYNSQINVTNYVVAGAVAAFRPSVNWYTLAFPLLGTCGKPLQTYYRNDTNATNANNRHYTIGVAEYPAIIP